MSDSSKPDSTVQGVQFLRGIAAIFVVLVHANAMMRFPEYFGSSPVPMEEVGLFGVSIFFVISGFIIAIVSLDGDGLPKLQGGEFFRRRLLRIIPFMWICIIGYNVLSYLGTGSVEWDDAARAMVLWPIGDLKPNVIWTLRHEALFYSIFAVTMLLRSRLPWLLVTWLTAPLIVTLVWPDIVNQQQHVLNPTVRELLDVVLVGSGSNVQFGAGLLLGLTWLKRSIWIRQVLPWGPFLGIVAATAGAVVVELASPSLGAGAFRFTVWTLLAAAVVWMGVVTRPTGGPVTALWLLLGNASYSIYLVHNAALLVLLEASARVELGVPPLLYLAGFVVLATAFGIAVHLIVEKPLLRKLTAWRAGKPLMPAATGSGR